jgi:hypothetical protein
MENCEVYDQLVVDNHPVLTVRDTYINTLFSNVIDYSGIYTLSLKVYGGEIDTIDLSQILDSGIVQVGLEFFGVTIGSASFGVSPVSGNRQQALLAGCAVGSLTVYECVDVKAMSSAFPLGAAASISTPQALPNGGTVVPPTFAISPTSFAGSQTLVLTLPFNLYSTNYVFAVEGNQIADLPIAVDSKGQTSITVKSSNGAPNGTVGGILQMY